MSVIPDLAVRVPGKYERLCFERHERDLALANAPGGHPLGLVFKPELGERAIRFVEDYCRHHKGEWAGLPLKLEEWQRRILRIVFGWQRPERNKPGQFVRRFRIIYIEIPRKNGKSELAAAIGLYLTMGDNEQGAEVYSAATKKDQAKIVWLTAVAMVQKSPELSPFVKSYQSSLQVPRSASSFQPLGADSNTLDGLNPHAAIIDELHAHKDRGVWDVLKSAMGARRQPMMFAITTAGILDETSIGWEQHTYAVSVLDGVFEDDSYFAFIASADEEDKDKWFDVATQMKANPNYGISVKPEYLGDQALQASRTNAALGEYLTKHLNVWSQAAQRWLQMDKWAACEAPSVTGAARRELFELREIKMRGRPCRAGLDLSSKLDLTALMLEFDGDSPDEVILLPYFWIPQARVDFESRRGRRHYETWVREGWITPTPGDVIDYEFIRKTVNHLAELYDIREIAFDSWNAMDLANRLGEDGRQMVVCRQGFQTLSEPSKDVEAKIVQGVVRHSNHPVMTWCASNAIIIRDSNDNIRPDKQSQLGKIDGVVAWVMARSRNIVGGDNSDGGAYKERGEFLSI